MYQVVAYHSSGVKLYAWDYIYRGAAENKLFDLQQLVTKKHLIVLEEKS